MAGEMALLDESTRHVTLNALIQIPSPRKVGDTSTEVCNLRVPLQGDGRQGQKMTGVHHPARLA